MGYVAAEIELRNPGRPELNPVPAKALGDTGAMTLCIPEHVALQLQLEAGRMRKVSLADGKKQLVPYVGPIEILFENRNCYVGALVIGDEVLLGAVPLEDMDLVISPAQGKVIANPQSPNFPHALVK
jgi:clan AA aspartic protease